MSIDTEGVVAKNLAATPSIHVGSSADRGASAVEYGLLIAGIAALVALAVYAFGGGVSGLFNGTCDEVASAVSASTC